MVSEKCYINKETIQNIAEAVRIRNFTHDKYTPSDLGDAIRNLPPYSGSIVPYSSGFANKEFSGHYVNMTASYISSSVYMSFTQLKGYYGHNVSRIYGYAFENCNSMSYVAFPKCERIYTRAFYSCSNLKYVEFSKCSKVDGATFTYCSMKILSLPNCEIFGEFNSAYLDELYIPKLYSIYQISYISNLSIIFGLI